MYLTLEEARKLLVWKSTLSVVTIRQQTRAYDGKKQGGMAGEVHLTSSPKEYRVTAQVFVDAICFALQWKNYQNSLRPYPAPKRVIHLHQKT